MLDWFKSRDNSNFLTVDLHSHLLPSLDDGVKTIDESLTVIRGLHSLGIKKIITTPHIISGFYPNTPEIISKSLATLKESIAILNIEIEIEAAAEYFVDEHFLKQVQDNDELVTLGDQYVLIETGFMNKPVFLKELIFDLFSKGYKPILAHPERYIYLQENYALLEELKSTGIFFQLNALSISGYYSKEAKTLATHLINQNMIDFVGSDIHHMKQFEAYKKTINQKLFQKCRQLSLLNNAL